MRKRFADVLAVKSRKNSNPVFSQGEPTSISSQPDIDPLLLASKHAQFALVFFLRFFNSINHRLLVMDAEAALLKHGNCSIIILCISLETAVQFDSGGVKLKEKRYTITFRAIGERKVGGAE